MDVIWQPTNIKRKRAGKAFLRCYKNGSIRISSTACELVSDFDNCNYAKFYTSSEKGEITKIGIKFVDRKEDNAVCVHKISGGAVVYCKFVMRYISTDKKYGVKSAGGNMIYIDL